MQKKHYTKKSESTFVEKQEYKIYTNCQDLPLYNFLKVITEEDFNYLVIYGNPEEEVLQDAWEQIFNEYSDLYKDKQKQYVVELIKEITVYNVNINIIERIVNVMYTYPNESLSNILRSMGFMFKYNPENQEAYSKDLRLTISKAKTLLMKLENSKKQLDTVNPKGTGKVNYDSVIVTLSKFQGYRIDPKNTPVSEYVEVFNNYNKVIEAENARASIPG